MCGSVFSDPSDKCPYCRGTLNIEDLLNAPLADDVSDAIGEAMCCDEYAVKRLGFMSERIEHGRDYRNQLLRMHRGQ